MKTLDPIQTYFSCYERSNKAALENLLDDRLEFSSPHDNRLDKIAYLERCWGFNESVERYHILKFIENTNEAFLSYKAITYDKREIENAEYFKIKDGKIITIKVYYGNL
ncbi:hypothetical protein [Zobellia alginiliquefaciens]|uniref:hypothetical protein n=1 Tax=Zobellia alginiliquefaciens TaxID=3032586 RepID=UPI0023E3ACBD|nr:hypothetical protein [Zobellia alginiliquefaciens]